VAHIRHDVLGVDVDPGKVAKLQSGQAASGYRSPAKTGSDYSIGSRVADVTFPDICMVNRTTRRKPANV
jgi:hypothetical protein